jgi:hypothetical protein
MGSTHALRTASEAEHHRGDEPIKPAASTDEQADRPSHQRQSEKGEDHGGYIVQERRLVWQSRQSQAADHDSP